MSLDPVASPHSGRAYAKVFAIWLVGTLVTAITATFAGFNAGFSDRGLEGAKAWPAVIVVMVIGLGVMVGWTAAIVRRDHRDGGTVSVAAIAIPIGLALALVAWFVFQVLA